MSESADLVVVGAGTVGGWASVFAREDGAGRVVVVDAATAGAGASSRAAGMVRTQGGTPTAVDLGRWTVGSTSPSTSATGSTATFAPWAT